MKALTVVGTLAAVLALAACGRQDEGTTAQHTDVAVGEQRANDSSNATVDSSRDAAGSTNADVVAGTTVNRPGDAAQEGTYGSDASAAAPGGHDAVVTGTPQGAGAVERAQDSINSGGAHSGENLENAGQRAGQALESAGERAADATARGVDAAGEALSDGAITASVKAQLARDEELSAIGINVDTDNGRVTLSGTAPNQAAVQRATQLAQQVRGVKDVKNALRVESR